MLNACLVNSWSPFNGRSKICCVLSPLHTFFKVNLFFIYLKGGGGERLLFLLLIHILNAHNIQGWAGQKPGAWNSVRVSHMSGRSQAPEPSSAASDDA